MAAQVRFFPFAVTPREAPATTLQVEVEAWRARVAAIEKAKVESAAKRQILEAKRRTSVVDRSAARQATAVLAAKQGVQGSKRRMTTFAESTTAARADEAERRAALDAKVRATLDAKSAAALQAARQDHARTVEAARSRLATYEASKVKKDAATNALLKELGVIEAPK